MAQSLSARTDVVLLTSGERLVGEVLPQSTKDTLVLKSALLGEISLPRSGVLTIEAQVVPETVKDTANDVVVVEAVLLPTESVVPAKKVAAGAATKKVAAGAATKKVAAGAATKKVAAGAKASQPKAVALKAAEIAEIVEVVQEEKDFYERVLGFSAPDHWQGNVRMGLNISSGDKRWTETALRGKLEIKEKGSRNFYRFIGSYTYRETEKNSGDKYKSTDRYDSSFTYRRSLDGGWFVQNAMGWRVDQVKGIDQELQDTVGIGYRLKPIQKFEVLFGGGGGIEDYDTTFDDTREGVNGVVNVFQELTWRPFTRTSVIQKFNYYWDPEASEQYNYIFSAAVRLRLTDLIGFEFSYNQNYDNDIGNGNPKDDAIWRNALIVYF